jgi:very-short-patch-repair endonuclease
LLASVDVDWGTGGVMSDGTILERAAAVASRQHGLITRAQLLELGLTARVLYGLTHARWLTRVHRGVYRVGPLSPPRSREMAAALACGPRALLSHESAAWLWEFRERTKSSSPVDVRVPEDVRIRRRGIRVHRTTRLDPDDIAELDSIPLTSPARTIVDLAARLGVRELERVVARAERERLVTPAKLAGVVARHPGQPGVATLARLIGQPDGAAFTRSELEVRFRDELARFGLPSPRFNARVGGFELDCWWPDARMAAELDGAAYHASWRSQENDRRRDRELAALGITVVRVAWRHLVDETELTMVGIAQALAISQDRLERGSQR